VNYELESGSHSTYLLTYHLVWCVKYRHQVLTTQIGDRLKEMVEVLLREAECSTIAIETEVDHIQVVFRAKPKHQLSKIINSVKGVTARRLFQEFPTLKNRLWRGHLWGPSYFLVTVGGAPLDVIKRYIETQRVK
jgi:putative transposase